MAKSLQQIRQDLADFEEKTTQLSLELNHLYRNYLEALSQSIKQQLILACYHICTQIYPEKFLKLSFSKREKLQNNLRQLGQGIQEQLLSYLTPRSSTPQATITEQLLFQFSQSEEPSLDVNKSEVDSESKAFNIKNPEELVNWCKTIEEGIDETLESLSQKANNYLHQAQIIPPNLPPQLLEMALQAEEGRLSAGGTPNIINLLVETNKDKQKKEQQEQQEQQESDSQVTKFSAIHLRLSDIVFPNPTLSIERKEIRKHLEKLKKMRQSYHQTQREYATAEAETAWRSSWYQD